MDGFLRQYFPSKADLSLHSAAHLNAVARELNNRPRHLELDETIRSVLPIGCLDWLRGPSALLYALRSQWGVGRREGRVTARAEKQDDLRVVPVSLRRTLGLVK